MRDFITLIEPELPVMEARSLNHRTTREVPVKLFSFFFFKSWWGLWLIRLDLDSMWGQGWAANPKCGGRDINGVRVGGCGGHKPCFPTTG